MTLANGQHIQVTSWVRFIIQCALILLAASGVYFRMDNRLTNAEHNIATNTSRIDYMDQNGTHKSHETDYGQQTQIEDLGRRVSNLESILRDLVPKVERIDSNVLILMTQYQSKNR